MASRSVRSVAVGICGHRHAGRDHAMPHDEPDAVFAGEQIAKHGLGYLGLEPIAIAAQTHLLGVGAVSTGYNVRERVA